MDNKLRQFKCPICNEQRERGVLVKLGKNAGRFQGVIVKVCKKGKCKDLAEQGSRQGVIDLEIKV